MHNFLNVTLVNKCISEYIYSRTIPIFEVEPYECQWVTFLYYRKLLAICKEIYMIYKCDCSFLMLPTVYFSTCTKIVSNVTLYALAIKCALFHGINLLLYVGIYLPEVKSVSCQTWGSHTFLEFIRISWPAGQVPCIPPAEFTCK